MLYIHNATIYTPQEIVERGALLVDGQRIIACAPAAQVSVPVEAEMLDAGGALIVPGFIDLQLNGALGDDFTVSPETIWRVAAGLPRWGVTAFLPTIITSPLSQVGKAQEVLAGGPPAGWRGSIPLGLHCEGPFLNPRRKAPTIPITCACPPWRTWPAGRRNSHVRLVTLAPELPGALPVIAALAGRGVVVSAATRWPPTTRRRLALPPAHAMAPIIFNAMPTLETS